MFGSQRCYLDLPGIMYCSVNATQIDDCCLTNLSCLYISRQVCVLISDMEQRHSNLRRRVRKPTGRKTRSKTCANVIDRVGIESLLGHLGCARWRARRVGRTIEAASSLRQYVHVAQTIASVASEMQRRSDKSWGDDSIRARGWGERKPSWTNFAARKRDEAVTVTNNGCV